MSNVSVSMKMTAKQSGALYMKSLKQEARIKELEQAQPKWISVEDRLPDNHSYVLVLGHGGTQFISLFTNNRFYRQSASKRLDSVTDWMPLPQQPEVK